MHLPALRRGLCRSVDVPTKHGCITVHHRASKYAEADLFGPSQRHAHEMTSKCPPQSTSAAHRDAQMGRKSPE
jgi:hypothetical protein